MGATGDQIKRERLRRKLTRTELARRTGVSVKTISRIENGERVSDLSFILEEHLGIAEPDQSETDSNRILRDIPDTELWAEATRRFFRHIDPRSQPDKPRYAGGVAPYPHHLDPPQDDKRSDSGS